jgi:hypothetical protein
MERRASVSACFDWSISRDIADPSIWIERYHCPTWGDYLRMRDRYTQADFDLQELADTFNRSGHGRRVRRRLERPLWIGALEGRFARSADRYGQLLRAVSRRRHGDVRRPPCRVGARSA